MSIGAQLPRVSISKLHAFTKAAFVSAGLNPTDASVGADVLVTTDAWGVFTHGTKNLRGYLRRLQAGGLQASARPAIVQQGAAWAVINGNAALGMITSVFAMQTAIAKAKQSGIAFVGVRNSSHYGAAGYYTWLAAREGLIGLSMANDIPSVAAPGSRAAITGSNPLAYAVPAGKHGTMGLDMSIATVAGGKVYAARQRGEAIPGTWLVGADGKPTTDPSGYPETGALQPAAGHKGYGLALLIEMLAGNLSGAGITKEVGSWIFGDPTQPTNHGAAFVAIDVRQMTSLQTFTERSEALIDEIHGAPRADGVDRIYVPGEMEWERYDHAQTAGIALPSDVVASLREAAKLSGQDLMEALGVPS